MPEKYTSCTGNLNTVKVVVNGEKQGSIGLKGK